MPNYYMVKSGGSADGSTIDSSGTNGISDTLLTGTWSVTGTEYFDSVSAAVENVNNPAVAGDIVVVSSAHSFDNGGSQISTSFPTSGIPVWVVCVDNANRENKVTTPSGKEDTTSSIVWNGLVVWEGIILESSAQIRGNSANSAGIFVNCLLNLMTSNDLLGPGAQDGCLMRLINTEINTGDASAGIQVRNAASFEMYGGSMTGTALNNVFQQLDVAAGSRIVMSGVNPINVATSGNIFPDVGGAVVDDTFHAIIDKCTMPHSNFTWIEESLLTPSHRLTVTNTSDVSADAEWQLYFEDKFGTVEAVDTSGIVRVDSDTDRVFDGGETIAYKMITSADVSPASPLTFDFPSRFIDLSQASSDTVRVYFCIANTDTLDDSEFFGELIYPDGTNKHEFNFLSNRHSGLDAGTTHTTDSGSDWEDNGVDLTGYNEYYMDLDTSGDVGAAGVPILRISCGLASKTVYVSMHVDAVA